MDDKKVVLITGYEPFGGDDFNPSLELAKSLDGSIYKDHVFRHASIPVNRKRTVLEMIKAIELYKPEIIINTGLAWGRTGISVERVAINVTDFPIPDNEGYISKNETIDESGPSAYFASIPIRAVTKAMLDNGIPAYVSNTAGTYCCNMLMYGTLNYISKNKLQTRAGMIHVPFTPEQVAEKRENIPSMSLEIMTKAIEIAAKAVIDNKVDIEMICGAVN